MALGKILSKQSKTAQAREIYEKGCQANQGENAYIWQVSRKLYFCIGIIGFSVRAFAALAWAKTNMLLGVRVKLILDLCPSLKIE